MKRILPQFFITVVALLVTGLMIVSMSYAWLVLSSAPETKGISVSIGGGTTILLAPDVSGVDDQGRTYHHPGEFSAVLNLSQNDTYRALSDSGALSPVSTVDGIHWMTQAYDQYGDPAGFTEAEKGWICFDVWVVSPGGEYDLRVSTDKNSMQGSYLVELPDVVEEEGGYALRATSGRFAASARVGFLVNTEGVEDQDMRTYMNSQGYEGRYWKLQGRYDDEADGNMTGFLIYEPNATLHAGEENGSYIPTLPLNAAGEPTYAADHLTAQERNELDLTLLQAPLEACTIGQLGMKPERVKQRLFRDQLQGQIDNYLTTGLFYKTATDPTLGTAGAADDAVIVTLHKNVPQRIRVFLWLEGQDADCQATGLVTPADLALKLELAGSTA